MPKKKVRDYGQTGPSLWDYLAAPQDLRRPLTDVEKYLYMDLTRGIKIPRAAHYFRLPSPDLPPDCQLSPEEMTALHARALRSQSDLLLQTGATEHRYAQKFMLFSGGNDSALATAFAMRFFARNPDLGPAKVLHLDTGTGVAEAQQYVRELAAEYGYPLEVYKTDVDYDELVCKYGFPGAKAHGQMFGLLKRRPLRAAIADHMYSEKKRVAAWLEILTLYCDLVGLRAKDQLLRDYDLREKEVLALYINVLSHFPGTFAQQLFLLECLKQEEIFYRQEPKKVLLVTGARERESKRRMGIIKPLSEEGPMTWLAPFFDWDTLDVMDYMERAGIRPSPVYPFLHYSGECTCGSFALKGQLGDLLLWAPERGNHILELQDRVWRAGFHWSWEDQPPEEYRLHRKGQMYLPEFEGGEEEAPQYPNYLCSSCEFFHEQRQMASCAIPQKEVA